MLILPSLLHEPRFRPYWRKLLAILAGVTAWFAFSPGEGMLPTTGADKLDHVLAFGSMACATALAWSPSTQHRRSGAALLLIYGGLIEVVQTQIPGRHGNAADLLADAVGIGGGLLLMSLLRSAWPAVGMLSAQPRAPRD